MPSPKWIGPTDQLLEMPDSPDYNLSSGNTRCTRSYMGQYNLAVASILPRGTIGTGDMSGWNVIECRATRSRGAVGKLVITYAPYGAASGFALPPDVFSITPFEVNPALEKNRRYSSLTDDDFAKVDNCIRAFQKNGATPFPLTGMLLDLFNKKKRGNTNYYLAGFTYSWTRSYFLLTGVANVGGYIEAPGGPLGSFIPSTFSCLRKADDIKRADWIYQYTTSWLCGPSGHFDPDLYS